VARDYSTTANAYGQNDGEKLGENYRKDNKIKNNFRQLSTLNFFGEKIKVGCK